MRFIFTLTLGVAAAAGLAACGGGDTTTVTTVIQGGGGGDTTTVIQGGGATGADASGSSPESEQEFIDEADAICRPFNASIADIQEEANKADSQQEIVDLLREQVKRSAGFIEQLNDLDPPPSLEVRWNQYITALNAQQDALEGVANAAAEGDWAKFRALASEGRDSLDRKARAAEQIGLAVCGHN